MVRTRCAQHGEVADELDGRGKHGVAGISRSAPHVIAMDNGCNVEIGQPKSSNGGSSVSTRSPESARAMSPTNGNPWKRAWKEWKPHDTCP